MRSRHLSSALLSKFIAHWGQVFLNLPMKSTCAENWRYRLFHLKGKKNLPLSTKGFDWIAGIAQIYWWAELSWLS